MSEENVEIVRKAFEYWNRGDLDAFLELIADDAILRAAEGFPERVIQDGRAPRPGRRDRAAIEPVDRAAARGVRSLRKEGHWL